jgi:hypothetical protein
MYGRPCLHIRQCTAAGGDRDQILAKMGSFLPESDLGHPHRAWPEAVFVYHLSHATFVLKVSIESFLYLERKDFSLWIRSEISW